MPPGPPQEPLCAPRAGSMLLLYLASSRSREEGARKRSVAGDCSLVGTKVAGRALPKGCLLEKGERCAQSPWHGGGSHICSAVPRAEENWSDYD